MTPQEKANKAKAEAKRLLNELFKVPKGYESEAVNKVVEYLVAATLHQFTADWIAAEAEHNAKNKPQPGPEVGDGVL